MAEVKGAIGAGWAEFRAQWCWPANILTLERMLLFMPAFALVWPVDQERGLIIFGLGMLTDALDGWVARANGTADESLGKWLDPVADKVIMAAAFILIWPVFVSAWVIAARLIIEAALMATAFIAKALFLKYRPILTAAAQAQVKRKQGANLAGKIKTIFDTVLLLAMGVVLLTGQVAGPLAVFSAGAAAATGLAIASLIWHWLDAFALWRRFLSKIERHP